MESPHNSQKQRCVCLCFHVSNQYLLYYKNKINKLFASIEAVYLFVCLSFLCLFLFLVQESKLFLLLLF